MTKNDCPLIKYAYNLIFMSTKIFLFMEFKKQKTIGLIGGMSWESTIPYYRVINQVIGQCLGGLYSAKIVMVSVEFAELEAYQRAGDWDKCGELLADAAEKLEKIGADFIVICTNTMHKVVADIEGRITIPVLHIAVVTACEILGAKLKKVGLLGTSYTMEQDFYKQKLEEYGIEVLVPDEVNRKIVDSIIYDELCLGQVNLAAKQKMQLIISKLQAAGAEGIILGCTELGLLIKQADYDLPLFDTTILHAREAALRALR